MPVTGKERVASAVPTFSEGPSTARGTGPLNVHLRQSGETFALRGTRPLLRIKLAPGFSICYPSFPVSVENYAHKQ